MDKNDYWKKRAKIDLEAGERSAKEVIKETSKAWKDASRDIRKELESFYGRYASKNEMEAKKLLNPIELKSFKEEQKRYLSEIERLGDKAYTDEYIGYARYMSGRAAVSRMEETIANIKYHEEKAACKVSKSIGGALSENYKDGYVQSMYGLQKGMGVGFEVTLPDNKAVNSVIQKKWLGANYSDRIWMDKNRQMNNIENIIQRGIASGRDVKAMSKDIAERCNVSETNARRLATTEITHIRTESDAKAYADAGVESYEFDATLDLKTCADCRELDGKIFKLSDRIVGVNYPPLHPYDRCVANPYFDDIITDGTFRAGRGPNGKTIMIDPDIKYDDWKSQFIPKYTANPKAIRIFEELEKLNVDIKSVSDPYEGGEYPEYPEGGPTSTDKREYSELMERHYQNSINGMNKPEIESIHTAFDAYSRKNGSTEINAYLSAKINKCDLSSFANAKSLEEQANEIIRWNARTPLREDITLYRGLTLPKSIINSGEIKLDRITSFSMSEKHSMDFLKNKDNEESVFIEFYAKKGQNVAPPLRVNDGKFSGYPEECEFNANPGDVLKINLIEKKNNVYYLKVEME